MILLRHGQSAFNLHFRATGEDPGIPDAPLTPLGHRQAEEAAASLAEAGIRRIVCSPYTRALQTASPVAARLGLPILVTTAIAERFAASCDIGTACSALAAAWPHLDFGEVAEVWWPDAEEPHDVFRARTTAFRRTMAGDPDWAQTLVVCHWGVIMALTGQSLDNGTWIRLEPEDEAASGA
ncbi:histidine phosphatase family protein [Methylobacterium sp. ID0610]|uniref:histidine phosphatase family protein n=1 Tax=Methylobacterium carpenticola TaxID=3344827 RepID=UPI0036A37616